MRSPSTEDKDAQQIEVKQIKKFAGLDGIVPNLYLHGASHRLGNPADPPSSCTFQRGAEMVSATEDILHHSKARVVKDELAIWNGPIDSDSHLIPIASTVLISTPDVDKRSRPYFCLHIGG